MHIRPWWRDKTSKGELVVCLLGMTGFWAIIWLGFVFVG